MANEINWERLRCQEASILSVTKKIECGLPATYIVWSNKDQRAYPMCFSCAVHNIDNRGCVELAQK